MGVFSPRSIKNLQGAHHFMQILMTEAIKHYQFTIADGGRGKAEQEMDVALGRSKVHFPHSAHNWKPWVALDIYPDPFDFLPAHQADLRKRLKVLQMEIILPAAKKLAIPIRQGIDFNRDGNLTDDHFVDLPHVELYPWEQWAKESHPYV